MITDLGMAAVACATIVFIVGYYRGKSVGRQEYREVASTAITLLLEELKENKFIKVENKIIDGQLTEVMVPHDEQNSDRQIDFDQQ